MYSLFYFLVVTDIGGHLLITLFFENKLSSSLKRTSFFGISDFQRNFIPGNRIITHKKIKSTFSLFLYLYIKIYLV